MGDKSDEKENTIVLTDTPTVPSVKIKVDISKPKVVTDSDEDVLSVSPSPPPAKKPSQTKRARTNFSDDSSEEDFVPKKKTVSQAKKPASKKPTAPKPKKVTQLLIHESHITYLYPAVPV